MNDFFGQALTTLLIVMAVSVAIAIIGLLLIGRSIKRLNVPHDADFFTTMRMVPLPLVIMLDLLDFGLDIFATPIVWIALDRLGLPSLRNKAVLEALIPFSGPIPTFTIAWFAVRALNLGNDEMRYVEQYARQRGVAQHNRPTIIDMDDERASRYNR